MNESSFIVQIGYIKSYWIGKKKYGENQNVL